MNLVYEPVYIYIDSRVFVILDLSLNRNWHKPKQRVRKENYIARKEVVGCPLCVSITLH